MDPTTSATTETDGPTGTSTSTSTSTTDATTEGSGDTNSAICGDGVVDPGEECDPPDVGAGVDWPECLADCTRPAFHWKAGDGVDGWCSDTMCGPEWNNAGGPWRSGTYHECTLPCDGVVDRLYTDWFDVPAPVGERNPVLFMEHEHAFNICLDGERNPLLYDGGHVVLEFEEGPAFHLLPNGPEGDTQGRLRCFDDVTCPKLCDKCGRAEEPTPDLYFVGESDAVEEATRELDMGGSGRARLLFEVGYDQRNCDGFPSDANAWKIHTVHVGFKGG